jgi:riboflavin biosynthesis pyrimidine reductase
VFTDGAAPTLYVATRACDRGAPRRMGRATTVELEDTGNGIDVIGLVRLLRARGCTRIFVEGGGVTVSTFLAANALDRLQIAVAPLIIGDGRPALRLTPPPALADCHRPPYRVFRMGADVLFDCDLTDAGAGAKEPPDGGSAISRII